MNGESEIRARLEKVGYRVLHRGCPDFLVYKMNGLGQVTDLAFIEVKTNGSAASDEQKEYMRVLDAIGLKVMLCDVKGRAEHPDIVIPFQSKPFKKISFGPEDLEIIIKLLTEYLDEGTRQLARLSVIINQYKSLKLEIIQQVLQQKVMTELVKKYPACEMQEDLE